MTTTRSIERREYRSTLPTMSDDAALYSLVAGEGDGAMLGLAAGDSAGGAWELGYSAHTEQATVIAYHLIEHRRIRVPELVDSIRELDGVEGEEPVYRAETPHFRAWLDRAAAGHPVPLEDVSLDAGPRSVPLGVHHRRSPEALRDEVIDLALLFHSDAASILCGVAAAAAVAASCFAQAGRDLIAGVAEAVEDALETLRSRKGIADIDFVSGAPNQLRSIMGDVGVESGEDALRIVGAGDNPGPWDLVMAGLILAAPIAERDHQPIEQAARLGGSPLAGVVGAIVGARVGIRAWPWTFANDTWFAEIGRRLVRGPAEVSDLPIPYAVEQHLIAGGRRGFH